MAQRKYCAVCGSRLDQTNTSGVCSQHLHTKGACKCRVCLGLVQGRRAVAMQDRVYTSSVKPRVVSITLPAAPWE